MSEHKNMQRVICRECGMSCVIYYVGTHMGQTPTHCPFSGIATGFQWDEDWTTRNVHSRLSNNVFDLKEVRKCRS